eukprot:TRINITY_DN10294_c0_g1_i1.p1 TRINITY_DN10294_c0_g1~~TRINITY_DN10294_c0_g1_i1.p1  ORF type:complete len:308 (+),score=41.97 TRINITY_DN10294_c0_g1_i1:3-926(+)
MINEEPTTEGHGHGHGHGDDDDEGPSDGSQWQQKFVELKKTAFIPVMSKSDLQVQDTNNAATSSETPSQAEPTSQQEASNTPNTNAPHAERPPSQFGGDPFLTSLFPHPICPNCNQPLAFIFQLYLPSLPSDSFMGTERGQGLIQMFYCTDQECESECESFFAFSASVVVRLIPQTHLESSFEPAPMLATPPRERFPAQIVASWRPLPDYPHPEEAYSLYGVDLNTAEQEALYECGFPVAESKLDGYPLWVQGMEYPHCKTCRRQMLHIFQIASNDVVPFEWGDRGVGYVFRCPLHEDVLGFGFACG